MNLDQVSTLMKVLTAYDGRNVGEADLMVWGRQLADVDHADAVEAVHLHYGETSEWARPSDIREGAERIRNTRNRRPEVIAPGCFEPDPVARRRLTDGGRLAIEAGPISPLDPRVKELVAGVIANLPIVDSDRIMERARQRAQKERGRPEPAKRKTKTRLTGKEQWPPPQTDDIAALATRYLIDGYTPADVSERLRVSKRWCEKALRKFSVAE